MSRLLSIPIELRLAIFNFYFRSVTVRRGCKKHAAGERRSYHTSILTSCRQIYAESVPLLVERIALDFDCSLCLMHTLRLLTSEQISGLREIRIRYDMGRITLPGRGRGMYCFAVRLLGIFPGIRLDRLEIYDCRLKEITDWNLNEGPASFLAMSGWKEMHLVAPSPFSHRWLKASNWRSWYEALEERESGHPVEMQVFVAELPEIQDAPSDPAKSILVYSAGGQRPPEAKTIGEDDAYIYLYVRELRVIAKRSGCVPYAVDGSDLPPVLQPLVLNPEAWEELVYSKVSSFLAYGIAGWA
jgi:hypothetical protein